MREVHTTKCLADVHALVGEGPVWLDGRVFWVDIGGAKIFLTNCTTGVTEQYPVRSKIGAISPRRRGGFIAASYSGIYLLDSSFKQWTFACHPEKHIQGTRFNDGKCDSRGRFWVGSVDIEEKDRRGSLYVIHPDLRYERVLEGLFLSNGLDWSPDDSTFYLTDSFDRVIWAFDFQPDSGAISNRRIFAKVDETEGYPDGLCVDQAGFVWSARWNGARVVRYAPNGQVDSVWPIPTSKVAGCTFGGDDLRTLLVTTARVQLTSEELRSQPLAGGLFGIETTHRGRPVNYFAA